MMLVLYLSFIVSVSFYHGCNAGVLVTIDDKNITNGETVEVSAGSDLLVTCTSDDESYTVSLNSSDDTVNITLEDNSTYSVEYLVHNVMKENNNSMITCHDGRNTSYFYLSVTYAPEIMLSQTKYSGEEGHNLNISINISANPRVDSVHLNMSGVELNDANVTTSTDSIIFNELDRVHGGDYSVYGVNSEGEGPVTNFLLTVYYNIEFAASVNGSRMLMVTLNEGDTYTINCSLSSVGSNPPNTTVHINQDNGSMTYNSSEIDITVMRDTSYVCVANNGMTTAHFNYYITTPSSTPSPTGAGYTVSVSFGLVIIAIFLSFFIN